MKKNYYLNLQLFAEDNGAADDQAAEKDNGTATPEDAGNDSGNDNGGNKSGKDVPKYTDADLDRIINRKFAEMQKKKEKETAEAERLAKLSAEERNNERFSALERELAEYKQRDARNAMTAEARKMLQSKGVNASDALLSNLVTDDAETTKSNVDNFVQLFKSAVDNAVTEKLKGNTPKKGTSSGMTKEQILAVADRAERQKLIRENMKLFS